MSRAREFVVYGLTVLLVASTLVGGVTLPVAAADSTDSSAASAASNSSSTYVVIQGDNCTAVSPFGSGNESAASFYDYKQPFKDPGHYSYSSEGTIPLQQNGGSRLLLYNGSEGVSLVVVHDKRISPDQMQSDDGGAVTFYFHGLPADGTWAVEDDNYTNPQSPPDDRFRRNGSNATVDWMWMPTRTDGGAFTGLDNDGTAITIDPAFNEEAWGYGGRSQTAAGRYQYAGSTIHNWSVLSDDGSTNGTVAMNLDLSKPVVVRKGTCSFDVSKQRVDPNESVTFTAPFASDRNASGRLQWDFDGDGTVDRTTTASTTSYAYETPGAYNATVTYVDGNESKSETVHVTVRSPVSGDIAVPKHVKSGHSFTVSVANVSGSTPVNATWTLDDSEAKSGQSATYRLYGHGTHTITLTLVDADGRQWTTNGTVKVTRNHDDGHGGPKVSVTNQTNESVSQTVTHAKQGKHVKLSLPSGTSVVDYRTVETVVTTDDSTFDLVLTRSDVPPAGIDAPDAARDGSTALSYLEVTTKDANESAVGNATITFGVDQNRLEDTNASGVALLQYQNGSWTANDAARIGTDDGMAVYRATAVTNASASNSTVYAVALQRPTVNVTNVNVNAGTTEVGSTVNVTATVEPSNATTNGTALVNFTADGIVVDSRTIDVSNRTTRTVTFSYEADKAGMHTLGVNGHKARVTVKAAQQETTETASESAQSSESNNASSPSDTQTNENNATSPGFGALGALVALVLAVLAGLVAIRRR